MNARVRILLFGILVMLLLISSSPIQAARLPGASTSRTIADSAAVNVTLGESILSAPQAQGIYHVTGWLTTTAPSVIVFLEKKQDGVWWYMYSRTLTKSGAFGFYDLEYGTYRVRTFRSGVYRYCMPSEFKAGHKTDGSDVRQYVNCVS